MGITVRLVEKSEIADYSGKTWTAFNKSKKYVWDKTKHFMAAYDGKEVVAMSEFEIVGGVGELKKLIVSESHLRQGIASMLIMRFLDFCKEKRCHKVCLRTSPDIHEKAVKAYEKHGFKKEASLKNHLFGKEWWIMSRAI